MNKRAFKLLMDLLTLNKFYRENGISFKDFKEHLNENSMDYVCIWKMLFEAQRGGESINLNVTDFNCNVVFVRQNKVIEIKLLKLDQVKPTSKQRKQLGDTELNEWCDSEGKDFITFMLQKKGV